MADMTIAEILTGVKTWVNNKVSGSVAGLCKVLKVEELPTAGPLTVNNLYMVPWPPTVVSTDRYDSSGDWFYSSIPIRLRGWERIDVTCASADVQAIIIKESSNDLAVSSSGTASYTNYSGNEIEVYIGVGVSYSGTYRSYTLNYRVGPSDEFTMYDLYACVQTGDDSYGFLKLSLRYRDADIAEILSRLADIEALMGEATDDSDSVINKVREMIAFFSGIPESDTLAGTLATLNTGIGANTAIIPTGTTQTDSEVNMAHMNDYPAGPTELFSLPVASTSRAGCITAQMYRDWYNRYIKPSGGIPETDIRHDSSLEGFSGVLQVSDKIKTAAYIAGHILLYPDPVLNWLSATVDENNKLSDAGVISALEEIAENVSAGEAWFLFLNLADYTGDLPCAATPATCIVEGDGGVFLEFVFRGAFYQFTKDATTDYWYRSEADLLSGITQSQFNSVFN